ncbi:hypothetical protein M8J77_021649 [Diaphorina citri]|nr:hypothetical protein M8J77_021649 [Diaphorina citri]
MELHKLVRSVVARLLQAGLDVNIRTASGTALHEAALCGKLEVVKTLLEHGADLRIIDSKHNTVLDLLKQFPPHAVHDISTIINHYWADSGDFPVPPIPVPSLGSPYENVKLKFNNSSPGASPSQWEHLRDRRTSALSAASIKSMDPYHRTVHTSTAGLSRSLRDTHYFSDDLSYPHDLDDSVSVCSTASSSGGGSFYPCPMTSKVSPTPPKKPPRRNLSVSPSHLISDLSVASAVMSYEFLVSGGGTRSVSDTDDMQMPSTPRGHPLRRGKSADHCAGTDFKLRYSSTIDIDDPPAHPGAPPLTRGQSEDLLDGGKYQPIAITSVCENGPVRTTNPKRKLRRLTQDNSQENNDPSKSLTSLLNRGDLPFRKIDPKEFMPQPITVERILSPSSDRSNVKSAGGSYGSNYVMYKRDDFTIVNDRIRVLSNGLTNGWPLSPTHYQQPPTPDHPPPSAKQAEQIIQDRIRPLSQEYNNLKRKSRDMETETEDELLMLVFHENSSSSLSSSVSMSEKSTQQDTTTTPDVPFAGLLKGSVNADKTTGSSAKAERPTSLNQLKSVYDETPTSSDDKAVASVLSPFDEQEEWARISEIMATIGSGLVKDSVFVTELEQEFQARLGLSRSGSLTETTCPVLPEPAAVPVVQKSVGEWLESLQMTQYKETFLAQGYDDVDFLNGILTDADLVDMGISNQSHREELLKSVESLPNKVKDVQALIKKQSDLPDEEQICEWLKVISLEIYMETFKKNLFVEMERIKKIWEVELTAVLEINKPAHRKRILISLDRLSSGPNLDQIHSDVSQLKSNNQSAKDDSKPSKTSTNGTVITSGTETLRRNHKKSRPAPLPPPLQKELEEIKKLKANGSENEVSSETKSTQWKHSPQNLVNGSVTYLATYLGSTVVKDKTTESSKQAIQKMKQKSKTDDQKNNHEILFRISHQGVKFLNPLDKSLVCEHEIRNVHCACQDNDDLAHFAYITKDHDSGAHFCHVFFVKNSAQVVEIILTLGQAFEIASQLALRKNSKTSSTGANSSTGKSSTGVTNSAGHARSRSVNQITPGTPPSVQHSRSLSVHEGNYLNGGSIGELNVGKAPIACTEEL